MKNVSLDVDFCRAQFPPLSNGWTYFENAGGSYVPVQVIDAMTRFMRECQCQPGYGFGAARDANQRIESAIAGLAELLNASADEVVIGPSSTLNTQILARAFGETLNAGDEIVVTNQDHESNSGPWRKLAKQGVVVKEWNIDPQSGDLDLDELRALLSPATRMVCFPHVSNVVGSVNDVAAITRIAHEAGALVCVDGVAAVAHGLPDMRALDVDFYLFSLYKLYGPHVALLYGKRECIAKLANQNHFFHEGHPPHTLNPGGLNYESVASLGGVLEYFEAVHAHHFSDQDGTARERAQRIFTLFAHHEAVLMEPLIAFLDAHPRVRMIGRASSDPALRAPTVCIVVDGESAADLAERLYQREVACAHGHFYGYRCVQALGIEPEPGVLRFSMVHYNSVEEVHRVIGVLRDILT